VENSEDIRRKIKVALAERGLTLKAAARRAGIQYDTVVKVVNGDRPMRGDLLAKIARSIVELGDRE
jgi:predicted transcriptional regulator